MTRKHISADQLYIEAHYDYEYRKAEILTKLACIRDSQITNEVLRLWINQAIDFINEREI